MSTLLAYLPQDFDLTHASAIVLILALWGFYTPILGMLGRGSLNSQLHAVRMRWLPSSVVSRSRMVRRKCHSAVTASGVSCTLV